MRITRTPFPSGGESSDAQANQPSSPSGRFLRHARPRRVWRSREAEAAWQEACRQALRARLAHRLRDGQGAVSPVFAPAPAHGSGARRWPGCSAHASPRLTSRQFAAWLRHRSSSPLWDPVGADRPRLLVAVVVGGGFFRVFSDRGGARPPGFDQRKDRGSLTSFS